MEDADVLSPQHGSAHNVTLQSARRPDDDVLMTRYSPPYGQQLGDTYGLSPKDVRDSAGTPPQHRLAGTSFGGPSQSRGRGRSLLAWTPSFGSPSPSRGRGHVCRNENPSSPENIGSCSCPECPPVYRMYTRTLEPRLISPVPPPLSSLVISVHLKH